MKFEIDHKELAKELAQELALIQRPTVDKSGQVEDTLFTVESLAEYLSLSKQWVYERVRFNEIPVTPVGKFKRFRKSTIDKWLREQETPAVTKLSRKLKSMK